jgi:hypothetical protein
MATEFLVVDESMRPKLFSGPVFANVPEETKEYMNRFTESTPGQYPITPIAKWFCRSINSTSPAWRERPILNCYNSFKHLETNKDAETPPPWVRCHTPDGHAYKIKDAIHPESPMYRWPIYSSDVLSAISNDDAIPSTIIYGQVTRRYLRLGASSGIRLQDIKSVDAPPNLKPNFQLLTLDKKLQIGTITLDVVNISTVEETTATSKTIAARLGLDIEDKHSVIEVIVLSAGECSCKDDSEGMMYFELYKWEIDRAKECPGEVYVYYNVMFVRRREDNVAVRMGIGRVARDLWDEEGGEEIGIELG